MFNADPSWQCLLCNAQREDHNHLFFHCPLSRQIWNVVQIKGNFDTPQINWNSLIRWLSREWRINNLKHISWRLCLASTVYHIWAERNDRLHRQNISNASRISEKIIQMVMMKLTTLKGVVNSQENRDIALRWNLPAMIFNQ